MFDLLSAYQYQSVIKCTFVYFSAYLNTDETLLEFV
jgi:hypothetical protein